MQTDTNRVILSEISAYEMEQSANIHPRLCILHKWSHYTGYGIHLICNENWRGLQIEEIEVNSPAESAGLLRGDIVFAVNGRLIETEDFFAILLFIQDELKYDQLRFLVLDSQSAEVAQRNQMYIDENHRNCIRRETAKFTDNGKKFNQTMPPNASDRIVDSMNKVSDSINTTKPELRMCSIILRSVSEPVGISLQADTDFSHIITQVQSNSPAARAGIEQDDCILSLNNIPLLHVSFEDVLYSLAKNRNETKLNFLVAKKSCLLQSFQNHLRSNTPGQLLSSGRSIERNRASTLHSLNKVNVQKQKRGRGKILEGAGPATTLRLSWSATSEKTTDYSSIRSDLYDQTIDMDEINGYYNIKANARSLIQVGMGNSSPKQRISRTSTYRTSVSFSDDEQCTTRSSPLIRIAKQDNYQISQTDSDLNDRADSVVLETATSISDESTNAKQNQPLFHSIDMPASTALIPKNISDGGGQSIGLTNSDSDKQMVIIIHDSEMINQALQSERAITDRQKKDQSITGAFYIPDDPETEESHSNASPQHVEKETDRVDFPDYQLVLTVSNPPSDEEQENKTKPTVETSTDMALAKLPVSELPKHGYELHKIKLIKPTNTIPVGLELSKQTNSSQYIITAIVEYSRAHAAGLRMNDWLVKIEDRDIRLTDLHDVSQDIYHFFDTVGFVNMVVARKKPSSKEHQPLSNDNHIHSSTGLSKPITNKISNTSTPLLYSRAQSFDSNLDKIRHIALKESFGLNFDTLTPADNDQIQAHFVTSIKPISTAYRAGLRNGDCILTVNGIDVTNTSQEELQLILSKTKPLQLTVVKNSKLLESIESFKRNAMPTTFSRTFYDTLDHQQSKDLNNILFTDDQGPVYIKHCTAKKEPPHAVLGFSIISKDGFHLINDVATDFPAYKSGLRNHDIVLFVNKKNVQQLPYNELISIIRQLIRANQNVDLIMLRQEDVQRYQDYQKKRYIDWYTILSKIDENSATRTQTIEEHSHENQQSNSLIDPSSSLLAGARICVLERIPDRLLGFTMKSTPLPPFTIYKIEKHSSAEKAGLKANDILLSVNGRSVLKSSYEETIQLIKEAREQPSFQVVVNQSTVRKHDRSERDSESSSSSYTSNDDNGNTSDDTTADETHHRDNNAVQDYQRQRAKELSYAIRLCHLNTTNVDGTPASSFGFEISGNSAYEYPIITRVDPKQPGERAGLQANDIILKVNDRKTKGADFEKIKKAIEKAKRDGRVELLVIDKEAFHYCLKTNKKFKEPYIKVKHIFPRSKSSASYLSLSSITARASQTSLDYTEQTSTRISSSNIQRLPCQSEKEEGDTKPPHFDLATDFDLPPAKFIHPARRLSQALEMGPSIQKIFRKTQNETSPDGSIVDFVLHTVNNFFHNTETGKPTNLDYDIPPDRANSSKTYTPLLSTFRSTPNPGREVLESTRSHLVGYSNQSIASYDYIRDPRRCVLQIDQNRGLGFVLSATGDYDHTITSLDKNSIADAAGLQLYDELVEIDGIDVRNIRYEQVVDMLISAIRTKDTIEIYVVNNHAYSSTANTSKTSITRTLSNVNNNNNNNNLITTKPTAESSQDEFSDKSSKITRLNARKEQSINTSYPNLLDPSRPLSPISDRGLTGSVRGLSTGITASPKDFRSILTRKDSTTKVLDIPKKRAPVARLCRIRKFPLSPFYGFFLCGNPKKPGRVFVSNIRKNSSAAICGLRNGDYIIEVNGTNIQNLTYETILNIIKLHMEDEDLELLVLDKKSVQWYRRRKYPMASQTLPTIVHIEPIISQMNAEM